MDAISLGLGTPEEPFDFEAEREAIVKRIKEALASSEVPRHLRTTELTDRTVAGRKLSKEERDEVAQYDDYLQKLYDTREWKHCVQLLRDRLVRLPPQFNTFKLLIHAEANCGALDMAAKHAQEAYEWDPMMGEAYVMMAKLDCMAMQPDRAEAWLALAAMVPGNEEECGAQVKATKSKIVELREAVDKMLSDVTHLFCLPDFWVRLSKNVEYYRTFASEETRAIVSEVQRDPNSLRRFLKNEKIQWLTSMLSWTSAPLSYSPPSDEALSLRHRRQMSVASTSTFMALPIEILFNILDFVDPPSLGRLPQISLFWRDLLSYDHRVWKRLYLNLWDPPIIYHVPDWLWIHAFRQRYGLCLTLARIWRRRDGDYAPTNPSYEANVRHFLSKFSFISPSFSDSLSLIPDFIYGNVNHNLLSTTKFKFEEVETTEDWAPLPSTDSPSPSPSKSPSHSPSLTSSDAKASSSNAHTSSSNASSSAAPRYSTSTPTSAKLDPEESEFLDNMFTQSVIHNKTQPEPKIQQLRSTAKKAIPIFSRPTSQSLFDSNILNVCYFVLSKSDYGDESQQAAKALAALAFHNRDIAHHLLTIGALERISQFSMSDQYGEAADLVATLLLHRHGVAMEASESLHSACKIFPRLWALNVVQDIKEVQRWVAGLSGIWHGRYFLGIPGYDVCHSEHFLYLQFHAEDMNFGHFVPQKDLKAAIQDFRQNFNIKTEYRFNSAGYIPPSGEPVDPNRGRPERDAQAQAEAMDEQIFDEDGQGVQEGECRFTGSGLDDFGPYRVVGRLNVVYKTVYLAKRYEFEPPESQIVYLGGSLGVWGLGGALKSIIPRNGVWKWWKDGRDYSLDEMHEMHREAENVFQASVRARLNRDRLRQRLRTALTNRLVPDAGPGVLIGDEGLASVAFQRNLPSPDPVQLRRGLRWADVHTPLVDVLLDPIPPPSGPDISKYTEVSNSRGTFPGYVPPSAQSRSGDEDFTWYDTCVDCGPDLLPVNSLEDETARIEVLAKKPVAALLQLSDRLPLGHADVLASLIGCTNSLFQLEHMNESMHVLDDFAQDLHQLPSLLLGTPPIRRFQGESDEIYTRRRLIFTAFTDLAGHERYIMLRLHRAQALEDAQYLSRTDIPWHDARKLHITHRWVDDWLRHPVRMYITDQHVLQQKLAQELTSPNPGSDVFSYDTMNPETEADLVQRQYIAASAATSSSLALSPMRNHNDDIGGAIDEDMIMEDDEETFRHFHPTAAPGLNESDASDDDETKDKRRHNRDTITDTTDNTSTGRGWVEAGVVLLVGLALVFSIRLLASRNRR